jgi:sortase A
MLAAGAGAILFPHAADWFTTRLQAGDIVEHQQIISTMSEAERHRFLEEAHQYNRDLFEGIAGRTDHFNARYRSLLNPGGWPVMSAVTMPSLQLTVPIYHGTTDDVLYRGAGHHYGSSLPVGGENTHTVVTAHSGLMRARLFTELEQLGIGDQFFLTTGGMQFWYQVDQIVIVLPGDYQDYLGIEPGEDLATLFTCTPTGVNTHRLLVRGFRIPTPSVGDVRHTEMMLDAGFPWWAAIFSGVLMLGVATGRFALGTPIKARPMDDGPGAELCSSGTHPPNG